MKLIQSSGSQIYFAISGDILIITTGEGEEDGCYWHLVGRAKDADQHPTMHRTAPTTKNCLAPNVHRAMVEISWSRTLLSAQWLALWLNKKGEEIFNQ